MSGKLHVAPAATVHGMAHSQPAPRSTSLRLASKVGLMLTALLGALLIWTCGTLWMIWHLEGGAAAVNEAGRLRMQAWRLAHSSVQQAADVPAQWVEFERSLDLLERGNPSRPLFLPGDPATQQAFASVKSAWQARAARGASTGLSGVEAEALVKQIDALVSAVELRRPRPW